MYLSIAGDLKQAFLLIRINEDDQDAVRFHCIQDRKILETVVLRFTRLMTFTITICTQRYHKTSFGTMRKGST